MQTGENFVEHPFETPNGLGTGVLKYISKYPYTEFDIVDSTGVAHSRGKVALLAPNLGFAGADFLDIEVLYIGQAYGTDGKRLVSSRLKSHSTLQKIYSEIEATSPDKEVWLILCSFERQFILEMDGINKNIQATDEEDNNHIRNVFNGDISEKQHINFVEAGLIKYFKPEYNKVFKDVFPDRDHKSYADCYKLDINHLGIVLTTENLHCRLWSAVQAVKQDHLAEFFFTRKLKGKGFLLDCLSKNNTPRRNIYRPLLFA